MLYTEPPIATGPAWKRYAVAEFHEITWRNVHKAETHVDAPTSDVSK